MCTSCTNQAHYSLVRMCTPCSKPHRPPNWRSRSRDVVTSAHILIGSGTGAVHAHMVHIYICRYSMCTFVPLHHPVCHWSLCDSKLPHKWHLLCCFPHDMQNSTHSTLLAATSVEKMSTCKTVESYLSRTSSNPLLALEVHYPHHLTLPSHLPTWHACQCPCI